MNTRKFLVASLAGWLSVAAARGQGVSPPLPGPPAPTLAPAGAGLATPPAVEASPVVAAPIAPLPTTTAAPVQPAPIAPVQPAPVVPAQPAPPGYYVAPGYYAPPPGTMVVTPAQPYPYPPPTAAPVVVPAPVAVLVPAPPLPSYRWSVAAEALFLERAPDTGYNLGDTLYNPGAHAPPRGYTDSLYSNDTIAPLAAGLRLEARRKLDSNITLAATYWGLQNWSTNRTIYGDPNGQTVLAFSPYLQLPSLLTGLDDSLGYSANSQMQNVEFNVGFPLGAGNPYRQLDWLWGVRFDYFADQFALTGVDTLNSVSERLDYHTTNSLIGVQTGLHFVHGWDRFQWDLGLKVGLMANIYQQHGVDSASGQFGVPAGFTPYDVSHSGSDLSAVFELSLGARVRINENFWFRVGYQFYDITGLALAPRQLNGFNHGGNLALDGLSLGVQATW